jgi:hypothetical protein
MQTPWDHSYAQWTQHMTSSAIRELLKPTELPDIISFAGGFLDRHIKVIQCYASEHHRRHPEVR